jgi:hypothetical protein
MRMRPKHDARSEAAETTKSNIILLLFHPAGGSLAAQ